MTPETLGEYAIVRLLGRGDMAEVYEGYDRKLERSVAVKVILPSASSEPGFEERFRREIRFVAGLRHPHIVQVYDFGVADGSLYMVMEYLPGGNLEERLANLRSRQQTLPLAEAARILDALADALDYAHGHGAIHRAIKPSNIVFTAEDGPVLVDFDRARLLNAAGQPVGSPSYMAPEQALGADMDGRADQYALAAVLYEMLTGRPPFQGNSPAALLMQHVNTPPPPPRSLNPQIPEGAQAALLKALAKQPDQRYASVRELAAAFRRALPDAAAASPTVERETPWLAGLLQAANIFAPLIGKSPVPAEEMLRESRGRWAAAMGAIGILLASLQFIMGAISLISKPAALIGRWLPYVVAVLLAAAALLAVRAARRATSARQRGQALLGLAVILLAGVGWGGYTLYDRLRPPDSFLVLIADFDGAGASRKGDFAQRIGSELVDQLNVVRDDITVRRTLETYADADAARAAGERAKATMVIWGAYDDFGVTPHVELLRRPHVEQPESLPQALLVTIRPVLARTQEAGPSRVGDLSQLVRMPLSTADLDLFAAYGPQQITYLVAAMLATGLAADGQYVDALALFDRSLANAATAGSPLRGLEQVYFQRALARQALGRLPEAIADLEKAVEIDPGFMAAHYNLAIAYVSGCEPADGLARALVEAEAAVRLQPDDARALRLLGSLYQQASRYEDALAALQKAIGYDDQDALTYQLLATVQATLGQQDAADESGRRAIDLVQQALARPGADSYALRLTLGDAYVVAGRYPEAAAAYQEAARLQPDSAAAHRGLGNAYYWQGELESALAEYRRAAALAPQDPAARLLAGLIQAQTGDLAGAIASQEAAAELARCDPAPHLLLGGLYFDQGDPARAAAAYETALALDSTNADAWYVLAGLRYQLDEIAPAAQAAQEAVDRDPDLGDAQYLLGKARLRLGDAQAALPAAEAAVRLTPEDPAAQALLGDVQLTLKDWQAAAAAYEASLALHDDASVQILAGSARQQLGEMDAAIAHYRAATALDPSDGLAWQSLGAAYQLQDRLAEAASALEKAVALADNALGRSQLGAILLQQGDPAAAIAQYERAAELDPQEPRYRVRLGNLYASRGELAQAEAAFEAALANDAQDAEAYAGLADAAYRQCRINVAVQAMATAAGLSTAYRIHLPALYEAQGRAGDAENIYAELDAAPADDWLAHLVVAEHLARNTRWDEATRVYQQLLEAGYLPAGYVTSLVYTALGQIDYAQERLFAAGSEFELALTAYDANVDARAGLGDLALRGGQAADALARYDAALLHIAQYMAGLPHENAGMLEASLHIRRSIALAQGGEQDVASAALDRALQITEGAVALTPRSPTALFALGMAHLARGEAGPADAAFARAIECDQLLALARARLEADLARLQASPEAVHE
ncbi:MAG: Serine/threonine-protein kinase PknH [Chloroflexi bacterium ADurb.Bin325]|nr:MAG: Serine/threonine-protein kinase PknH [Chloroflexi bacterium ADurb.Bin325]